MPVFVLVLLCESSAYLLAYIFWPNCFNNLQNVVLAFDQTVSVCTSLSVFFLTFNTSQGTQFYAQDV